MDLNNMNDAALWPLLIEGNLQAWGILYKRHYALLLNYGLKFCRDLDTVKDCIQDVFLKLHKSKKLSRTGSPRVYLLKALRHTLYDTLLSWKGSANLEKLAFCIPESQDLFNRLFLKDDEEMQLSKQLLAALSSLPANQKTILYLRFVKGLPHKEIAGVMDINVQSSMNLVSRSLNKLRGLMKDEKSSKK